MENEVELGHAIRLFLIVAFILIKILSNCHVKILNTM